MHIKSMKIKNFRNFKDFSIDFKQGLNVIIGSNNSGKTNLLRAIDILSNPNKISIDDFNKNNIKDKFISDYKETPPSIIFKYDIVHSIDEDDTDDESIIKLLSFLGLDNINKEKQDQSTGQEIVTKYNLIASIKIEFHLDPKYLDMYKKSVKNAASYEEYFSSLGLVLHKYIWTFTNGITSREVKRDEVTNLFKINFIEAERSNTSIYKETSREINKFIKDEQNVESIKNMKDGIAALMKTQMSDVLKKISDVVENEENEIGLKKGNVAIAQDIRPSTSISEAYIIDVKDTEQGYIVPITHNGVGYNNLVNIYMLIKLSEISREHDSRILCLEEPEAHLHPAMQYKLFAYLKKLDADENLKQQIFVTTHSSNITAVAGIDNMYMFDYKRYGSYNCVYQKLENQFLLQIDTDNPLEQELIEIKEKEFILSKTHLMKFLDVTRSDMLFASKIILVEGIAEKLLIPKLFERLNSSYEDEHIAIVEIGGKHFEYFLDVYANNPVDKKVLCITDKDYKLKLIEEDENTTLNTIDYYRQHIPQHIEKLKTRYGECSNIKIINQNDIGRTFEDELFISNYENVLIAKQLLKMVLNEKLHEIIDEKNLSIDEWSTEIYLLDKRSTRKIREYLELFNTAIDKDNDKKDEYEKLFFASLFLYYAKSKKGHVALDILTTDTLVSDIVVPTYIEEGLRWLLL